MDTVCEFVQVNVPAMAFSLALSLMASPFQAALTYQQITLQEECLTFIETNTEVCYHELIVAIYDSNTNHMIAILIIRRRFLRVEDSMKCQKIL